LPARSVLHRRDFVRGDCTLIEEVEMAGRRRCVAGMVAILLGVAVVLAGCGQKGPLYFPDDHPKKPDRKSGLQPSIRPG